MERPAYLMAKMVRTEAGTQRAAPTMPITMKVRSSRCVSGAASESREDHSTPVSEDKGVVGEDQPAADEDSKRVVQLKHHRVHLGFL